jgi:archaeosine-15-forming tRNA-guanine transglycosylase
MADKDAVAAAYRTINENDPATADALKRLRKLYKKLGEDEAVSERAIDGILSSGPGAAARLHGTADAVMRANGVTEE